MTFEQYLYQNHTSKTADSYFREVDRLLIYLPEAPRASYKDIVNYLHTTNGSPRVLAAIKKYYQYLREEGIREDHPCNKLTIKKAKKPLQLQDLFSTEELDLLLNRESRYKFLHYRDKAIISLLIYQGLSPENVSRLRLEDIDFDSGTIYIMATKQLSRRRLELKAKQMNYFYKYIYEDRDRLNISSARLFFNKLGGSLTTEAVQSIIKPLKGLFLDKNLSSLTIRQSVISNWINEQKIPIEDVQLMAGHKWLSSTEKYRRNDMEKKKQIIEQFHPLGVGNDEKTVL